MSGNGSGGAMPVAPATDRCSPVKSNGVPVHTPRTIDRNSSVRAYRASWSCQSPKRRCSTASPPVTTFSRSLPPEIRW
jgi:hypothetical protein